MDHYRLRKYRGPETWARVREAYVAGESGPAVALRFDVGLANLRKRARAEGWSRKHIARKLDLPPMRGERDGPPPAIAALNLSEDMREALAARLSANPTLLLKQQDTSVLAGIKLAAERASWLLAVNRPQEAIELIHAAQALAKLAGLTDPKSEAAKITRKMLLGMIK